MGGRRGLIAFAVGFAGTYAVIGVLWLVPRQPDSSRVNASNLSDRAWTLQVSDAGNMETLSLGPKAAETVTAKDAVYLLFLAQYPDKQVSMVLPPEAKTDVRVDAGETVRVVIEE